MVVSQIFKSLAVVSSLLSLKADVSQKVVKAAVKVWFLVTSVRLECILILSVTVSCSFWCEVFVF